MKAIIWASLLVNTIDSQTNLFNYCFSYMIVNAVGTNAAKENTNPKIKTFNLQHVWQDHFEKRYGDCQTI
jgi:hypothetical protein